MVGFPYQIGKIWRWKWDVATCQQFLQGFLSSQVRDVCQDGLRRKTMPLPTIHKKEKNMDLSIDCEELAEKVGHSTSVVRKRFDDMTRKKHVSKWTNEEDDTLRKMMVEERKDHSILNTMAQKMKKRQDRVWRAMGLVEVRRRKSKAVSRRTGEQG
ncbi:unnamed protein product [Brassica rapa]|uniref:Myb-like domain-containing protein n=1 Tax=Brassica campestris TaxID=3711 RepID=A0A8D9H260_BRACM|nr:unnamed protein product [Brassica rapa]